MLLYPLYALLFAGAGLSTAQISWLFVVWSLTGLVLEVPSGVLADMTSRRALLVTAQLLTAAAFALWVAVPVQSAFAAGFVLWGAAGALQSGALEALVYDELDRAGAAGRYAEVVGRATAIGTVAATAAIGLAAPVVAIGGLTAVGIASVVACAGAAVAAAGLPEHRVHRASAAAPAGPAAGPPAVPAIGGPVVAPADAPGGWRAHAATLRAAAAEARSRPRVRGALLLVPFVTAVWGTLDEYVPLLAADTGADPATVALLFLVVYLGATLGGVLGGRAERLAPRPYAVVLAGCGVALAAGALTGVMAGFVLIGVAFCGLQAATIAAGARLQRAIEGDARATITSLAGLLTELLVLALLAAYGLGSTALSHAQLFAAGGVVYLLVGAATLLRRR